MVCAVLVSSRCSVLCGVYLCIPPGEACTAHHIGHVCVQALVKTSVQCRLGRQRMEYGVFVFVHKYNNEGE